MRRKGSFALGFFLISLILIVIASFVAYLFGSGRIVINKENSSGSPSPLATYKAVQTPSVTDEKLLVAEAVYEKTGLTKENADVTVSKIEGNYATGGVKEKDAVGGAYFIAAKTDEGWVCVYDGQSTPGCDLIKSYNFPVTMVPQCQDATGKVISR